MASISWASKRPLTVIAPVVNKRCRAAAGLERLLVLRNCPHLHRVRVLSEEACRYMQQAARTQGHFRGQD